MSSSFIYLFIIFKFLFFFHLLQTPPTRAHLFQATFGTDLQFKLLDSCWLKSEKKLIRHHEITEDIKRKSRIED
ncbi:hypothetical protein Sjap_023869 [Stephania japonica]|uniref:Uncharacterized protein n=1 Tax=Stephania japonica TaxID=461633 RepID=A0AAP0EH61_9MAGN